MSVDDLYRILRTSHVQAQGIVDTIQDPLLVLDESLRVKAVSRSFLEFFNVDSEETLGQYIYDLGNGQWDVPDLRLLLTRVLPRSAAIVDFLVEHEFPDIGQRSMLLSARTLFRAHGRSESILISLVDATERLEREAAKDMLARELRHRMTNLLATTQSLARQTATKGRSAEEYRSDFLGRFGALVAAQDLSFDGDGLTLQAVLEQVLAPYLVDAGRICIEPGPAVDFDPRVLMSFGLVVHELATNAAKHGALSDPAGRVRIRWLVSEDSDSFRMEWMESGGPPVEPPETTGFGTKLIQFSIAYGLGGTVEQHYAKQGLRVEIFIPLPKAPDAG